MNDGVSSGVELARDESVGDAPVGEEDSDADISIVEVEEESEREVSGPAKEEVDPKRETLQLKRDGNISGALTVLSLNMNAAPFANAGGFRSPTKRTP